MLLSLWCWHDDWRRWAVLWRFCGPSGFLPGMCTLFEVSHALWFSAEVCLPKFRHTRDVFMICNLCLFLCFFVFKFQFFFLGVMIALCVPVIPWISCGYSADFSCCSPTFVRGVSSLSCIVVRPAMYSREVSLTVYLVWFPSWALYIWTFAFAWKHAFPMISLICVFVRY